MASVFKRGDSMDLIGKPTVDVTDVMQHQHTYSSRTWLFLYANLRLPGMWFPMKYGNRLHNMIV